jgi:hypothetical protein
MFSFLRSLLFGTKTRNSGEKPMVSTRKKTKSATGQRTNPAPSKQVVLLEEDEESTDLLPQGITRSEVNFLTYPFFALSRKDAAHRSKTEYSATITRGDERLNVCIMTAEREVLAGKPCAPYE